MGRGISIEYTVVEDINKRGIDTEVSTNQLDLKNRIILESSKIRWFQFFLLLEPML